MSNYLPRNPVTIVDVDPNMSNALPTRGGNTFILYAPAGGTDNWVLVPPGLYQVQSNNPNIIQFNYNYVQPVASGQRYSTPYVVLLYIVYPLWVQADATGLSTPVDFTLLPLSADATRLKTNDSFVIHDTLGGSDAYGNNILSYIGYWLSQDELFSYAPTSTGTTAINGPIGPPGVVTGLDIPVQAAGTGVSLTINQNSPGTPVFLNLTPYPSGTVLRFPSPGLPCLIGYDLEFILSGTVSTFPVVNIYFRSFFAHLNQ